MKKRMISCIKPTGAVTLGNYLGAIKPFVSYQDEYDLNLFIADLHALTIYQDPKELRENTDNLIAIYLAAGLDPSKVKIFKQSDVPAHNQLDERDISVDVVNNEANHFALYLYYHFT